MSHTVDHHTINIGTIIGKVVTLFYFETSALLRLPLIARSEYSVYVRWTVAERRALQCHRVRFRPVRAIIIYYIIYDYYYYSFRTRCFCASPSRAPGKVGARGFLRRKNT